MSFEKLNRIGRESLAYLALLLRVFSERVITVGKCLPPTMPCAKDFPGFECLDAPQRWPLLVLPCRRCGHPYLSSNPVSIFSMKESPTSRAYARSSKRSNILNSFPSPAYERRNKRSSMKSSQPSINLCPQRKITSINSAGKRRASRPDLSCWKDDSTTPGGHRVSVPPPSLFAAPAKPLSPRASVIARCWR